MEKEGSTQHLVKQPVRLTLLAPMPVVCMLSGRLAGLVGCAVGDHTPCMLKLPPAVAATWPACLWNESCMSSATWSEV